MASVRFELSVKGGKENDRPELLARLRYGTPQKRISSKTGLYGFRDYWSDKKQTHAVKLANPLFRAEVIEVNEKLATLKARIETQAADTPTNEISRDWLAAIIEDVLHPVKAEKEQQSGPKMLIQAVKDFIDAAPTTIRHKGRPICAARLNHYKQVLKNLQDMGADGVTIEKADKAFYDSFVRWMFANGYKQNTIATRVKCIKSVINSLPMAERVNCEFVEPKKCAAVMEDIDNCYLDENELQALAGLDLAENPHLDRVRDQFLLLAWTGCRYSDLGKLTRKYIVNEDDYEYIRRTIRHKMGAQDDYLEVFVPDMVYSEEPLTKNISEDLADIYQDVKDFIGVFRMGNQVTMHDALARCQEHFEEYWGQRLVNTMRALHDVKYNQHDADEEPLSNEDENNE